MTILKLALQVHFALISWKIFYKIYKVFLIKVFIKFLTFSSALNQCHQCLIDFLLIILNCRKLILITSIFSEINIQLSDFNLD